MAKLRTSPKWLISGISEAGYYVYFYIAGTSTPKDTYSDSTESAANTNPVILDSRGEADIWVSGIYKVVVYTGDKDVDGVLVWSVDNYGAGESQVQIGEFNLVKNGSFETDAVSNGEPDLWTIVDYLTGSHELDSTDQYHGLNSLKFTSTGSGGGHATSDYFEVQEAKEIFLDWAMRSTSADVRNVVDIIWSTAAKAVISTTNVYDDSATNPTAWTAKTGSGVPPSTARYAQLRVYGCHSSDSTQGSTWFDNMEAYSLRDATTTRKGIAEIATQAEVDAGADTTRFVTPATLPIASQAEVDTGTDSVKYVTPETLKNRVWVYTWTSPLLIGSGLAISGFGAPALAALNGTDVAFIDANNDSLRTYRFDGASWALVGSGLAITSVVSPALAALNGTDVAYIDSVDDELRTYRFDGSDWVLVGSGLAISGFGGPALAALNGTDVALIDTNNNTLKTYRFDGSDWVLVGNGLSITITGNTALAALNGTDVAYIDSVDDELRTYRFDGSDWVLVGSGLAISGFGSPALAALNGTDVALIDGGNEELRTYRFDGSDWAQVGSGLAIAAAGRLALAALNGTDVAFIDANNNTLKTYRFGFSLG